MKTSVRIGAFEIDDGELHGESPGDRTLTIPCKSDPDLCMQLDAWDAETSIPALLNGEHSVLYRTVTINNLMPGLCVLPNPKRTRRHGGLFVLVIPPL
ncbi:protein [Escherichia coli]|uniref:Protein n=4 Tax=Gammaproteobacteria TaxID=1236 RepID=A0A377D4Z0_ECOLX|nr:protein [Escherichia coli]